MQTPTKRKDITPVAQEPDFLDHEDEPEVTLPEGYEEMDFDEKRKTDSAEETSEKREPFLPQRSVSSLKQIVHNLVNL